MTLIFVVITLMCALYAAKSFKIDTDVEKLIDARIDWRRDEIEFEKAFPQRSDLLVAVLDGPSPEIAEDAASKLMEALAARLEQFKTVYRPDGGAFIQRNGLLLLPQEDFDQTIDNLSAQQALLGPLASDPTLRGVLRLLYLGAKGVGTGDATIQDLNKLIDPLNTITSRILDGRAARMSW